MHRPVKWTAFLILFAVSTAFTQDFKTIKWQIDQMSQFSCDVIETRKFVDENGLLKREVAFANHLEFTLENPTGYKLVQHNLRNYDHKGLYDDGLATLISLLLWSEYQWQPTSNPTMFYLQEKGGKRNKNMVFDGMALVGPNDQIQSLVGTFKRLSYGLEHLNIVYQLSPVYSREGVVYLPSLVIVSARSKGLLVNDGYNELRLEYTNWHDRRLAPSSLEQDIFSLINTVRKQGNLPTLKYNPRLASGARAHSKNLALYGYGPNLHVDAFRKGFSDRAKDGARKEIVAFSNEKNPVGIVNRWLQSPSHKDAILSPSTEGGVGVYEKDGVYYTTQWFK